jgi:cytochrome c-type biogenesis protein CcmH/NrfG
MISRFSRQLILALVLALVATNPVWAETTEQSTEEKIADLNSILQADPTDGKSWNDLGVLYALEGQFDKARDSFIRAVQTAPQEGDFHRNLGQAFLG